MSTQESHTSTGVLIVISGPSGVGKGTIVNALIQQNSRFCKSISYTTRSMRPGEKNGTDYMFLSVERFLVRRDLGMFLETAEVHGNYYGTPIGPVKQHMSAGMDVILEIDVQGAEQVRNSIRTESQPLPFIDFFIMPPDIGELESRLRGRKTDSEEVIARRLHMAHMEMARSGEFMNVIVNDSLSRAVQSIVRLIGDFKIAPS